MNLFHSIWQRLRSLALQRAAKREIDEELRFHLEQRIAENIATGMSPEQAAREARKRFGNLQSVREECRETRGANPGERTWMDIKFGARMLRRSPGFTSVAVLTLALGIGANTSMFSLLNVLLFRPGPYPHPDRLVRIFRTSPQSQSWPHSAADLLDYHEQNTSFDKLAFYTWNAFNLARPGEPAKRLMGVCATADLLSALGVNPMLGRVFDAMEDQPGNSVVILDYNCWRCDFGADTNIIGRTVRLDGENVTVIGVMPASFEYYMLWGKVDLWRPLALTPEQRRNRGDHSYLALGRLKPAISRLRAEAEMKAICARLPNSVQQSVCLVPLISSVTDGAAQRVSFSFGLAGFVLLIACANLANLQLARAAKRWREFAVRNALGASRIRLLRQSLTESLLIAAAGGTLGLSLASFINGFIGRRVALITDWPSVHYPLDGRVFFFALVCSVLTGIVFGIAPAWLASRSDVNDALKEDRRGAIGARWQNWLRQAFIVGELALALSMLSGAGLFIGALKQLTGLDPGWRLNGLLTGSIALNSSKYGGFDLDTLKAKTAFCQQLETRLGALPGVESVSFSWSLPIEDFNTSTSFSVDGQPAPKPGQELLSYRESVSPAYFHTLGIELRQGRVFTSDDTAEKPLVVVINEAMARRFWPGESPVGKRINIDGDREIVGVVKDVRFPAKLGSPDTPFETFCPSSQVPLNRFFCIAVRTKGDSESLAGGLRQAVTAVDTDQSISDIRSAREAVERAVAGYSLIGTLLAAFAALGLALAAIGIYAVISCLVAQRTGEIGIRMALGAQKHQVLWLVLRHGVVLCLGGTLLGFAGSLAIARLLSAVLPELSVTNPMAFGAMTALLMTVALLACYIPARRATRVDPMTALRYE
jgi:predicted permease